MTFTVKYRAIDGKMREECIEAASRSECIAKCKARGIAPVSVKEGGISNANRGRCKKRAGFNNLVYLIVGLIGIGASIWVWNGNEPKKIERSPVKSTKKTSPKTQRHVPPATNIVQKVENTETEPKEEFKVKRYGRSSNVPVDDTNRIHMASTSGLKVIGEDGVARPVRSKPIFKNRFDNMMWAAIRPGGMPSGLNALRNRMRFQTGSDEAFFQALKNHEITIEPDDPPHIVTAKNLTIEAKEMIVKEMDAGRSFDELYREICQTTRKERSYERIAQEEYRKVLKSNDPEAVRKYVEDMNPVMQEMGLREMRIPSWAEEQPKQEQ